MRPEGNTYLLGETIVGPFTSLVCVLPVRSHMRASATSIGTGSARHRHRAPGVQPCEKAHTPPLLFTLAFVLEPTRFEQRHPLADRRASGELLACLV